MPSSSSTYGHGQNQLSDGSDDGTNVGQSASDKVAFYGTTPVTQASAIPAVTGTVSLTTTINAILTVIRDMGQIAS